MATTTHRQALILVAARAAAVSRSPVTSLWLANVAQALADVFVYEHCGAFLVGRAMTTQPRPEPKR